MTTVSNLPAAPNRSMTSTEFTTTADAFVAALEDLPGQINAVASETTSAKNSAATSESNAASSAAAASSSASAAAASAAAAVSSAGTNATSTTSNSIGSGSKTFTIQTGKAFVIGAWLFITRTSDPTKWMLGQVTAHNSGSGSITFSVASGDTNGSGTFTDWTLTQSSIRSQVFNQIDLNNIGASIRPSLLCDFANSRNVDSRFTYTMNSPLTYTDAAGVVRYAAPGVPAFDHDPTTGRCMGLSMWEARTNRLLYSEDFTQSPYSGSPSWYTRTLSSDVARPDKAGQVNKFVATSTPIEPLFLRQSSLSLTSGTSYAGAIYIYIPAGQGSSWSLDCDFNDVDPSTVYSSTTFGAWVRATVTKTLTSNRTYVDFNLKINGGSPPSGFYFYATMVDLQDGTFATPYIPTTTGAITRVAPTLTMLTSAFDFNANEGSMLVAYTKAATSSVSGVAALNNGSGTDYVLLRDGSALGGSPGSSDLIVYTANVSQVDTNGFITENDTLHISMGGYKAGDFVFTGDGNSVLTDTSGNVPVVDRVSIGGTFGGGFNGYINKFAYYPRRFLTNTEYVTLSTL